MSDVALPRPFYSSPWSSALRPAAKAFWDWHSNLTDHYTPRLDGSDLDAYYESEKTKTIELEPLSLVAEEVWQPAFAACENHDLSPTLLASQIDGARRRRGTVRFDTAAEMDAFMDHWVYPHALLLAQLAGSGHSWQEPATRELARGFFMTKCLASLPQDLEKDKLFIPLADLHQTDVSIEQLERGMIDDGVRRLFWKQSIRIQDALAQGQDLVPELSRAYRNALKRYWLGALEVLSEIKRREYDVWSEPIELSTARKIQVYMQAWLGSASSGP